MVFSRLIKSSLFFVCFFGLLNFLNCFDLIRSFFSNFSLYYFSSKLHALFSFFVWYFFIVINPFFFTWNLVLNFCGFLFEAVLTVFWQNLSEGGTIFVREIVLSFRSEGLFLGWEVISFIYFSRPLCSRCKDAKFFLASWRLGVSIRRVRISDHLLNDALKKHIEQQDQRLEDILRRVVREELRASQ